MAIRNLLENRELILGIMYCRDAEETKKFLRSRDIFLTDKELLNLKENYISQSPESDSELSKSHLADVAGGTGPRRTQRAGLRRTQSESALHPIEFRYAEEDRRQMEVWGFSRMSGASEELLDDARGQVDTGQREMETVIVTNTKVPCRRGR